MERRRLMSHLVKCRVCKERFDTEQEDTIRIGKQSYYHKKCYEGWVREKDDPKAKGDKDYWYEAVVDFLYRDVQMAINFVKLNTQWESFTKPEKSMTPKGIYFAVRYYYTVIKGDKEKAQGGIGIVPSIYKESAQYWEELENKKSGTLEAIIQQIEARRSREKILITRREAPKKDKAKFSLDDV